MDNIGVNKCGPGSSSNTTNTMDTSPSRTNDRLCIHVRTCTAHRQDPHHAFTCSRPGETCDQIPKHYTQCCMELHLRKGSAQGAGPWSYVSKGSEGVQGLNSCGEFAR
ncbi:unnamed protein product [Prorocentrum cordatum]|uniref:Uncharacterized protein n=1 Tax=Prorocentrum cordatum TaxID=2364126 RepID=A0ABN9VQJ0_9DINO|nr:unnamed protein product [Polarella glacialis]